jgi:hypothetical protein
VKLFPKDSLQSFSAFGILLAMKTNAMTEKETATLEAWKAWAEKMKFLRQVHVEIEKEIQKRIAYLEE